MLWATCHANGRWFNNIRGSRCLHLDTQSVEIVYALLADGTTGDTEGAESVDGALI